MSTLRTAVASLSLALYAVGTSAQVDSATNQVRFEIKSQILRDALNQWAQQTGLRLISPTTQVTSQLVAPAVTGTFSPRVALEALLANTPLTYELLDERTIVVRQVEGSNNTQVRSFRLAAAATGNERSVAAEAEVRKVLRGPLEEIVVTATKRTENVLDVPISIAVVTADEIDRRGLVDAEDYLRGIPGVNQTAELFGQSIIIRGIETSPAFQNYFGAATVATYFGETPTTSSGGAGNHTSIDVKLMDVERVEVLRGPQGTAFGSGALGGVVRVIPAAPKLDQFEAKVAAGYSVTSGTGGDNHDLQGMINLPLVDEKLVLRATGYRYANSGYYRNVSGSNSAANALIDSAITQHDARAFAVDKEEVGAHDAVGGRLAALFQATDALKFTLSYLKQDTEIDGYGLNNATSGKYDYVALQSAPEHSLKGRKHGFLDSELSIANAIVEYDFGWADLLATYSYIESESPSAYSSSIYARRYALSTLATSKHRGNIAEIRLATQLDGPWNFLGGVYTEDLDDEATFLHSWIGTPAAAQPIYGVVQSGPMGYNNTRRNLKQNAAFAELSWEFLPKVTLTGGARLYEYDRFEVYQSEGPVTGTVLPPLRMPADASGNNFRANLSYKPTDDSLVYAAWSQGFRLGYPQPGLLPSSCDFDNDGVVDGTNTTIESTKAVKSDSLDNYEIGGKFTLLNRRLTIAADVFRIDWTDVPVLTLLEETNSACYSTYTANAGTVRSEGVEFQANVYVTDAFRIDVGGSWTDARIMQDLPVLGVPKGNRLPASPEFNANLGLQYGFDLGNFKTLLRADTIYIGSYYGNLAQTPDTKAGEYVKVDALARMSLGQADIDLFVRNVTNEDAFTTRSVGDFVVGSGYRLQPRTIGLQLSYKF